MRLDDQMSREEILEELRSLRKSYAVLHEGEELTGSGSWLWDIENDSALFSRQWLDIHGVEQAGLSMDEMFTLIHPDDRLAVMAALRDALDGAAPFDIEHRVVRRSDAETRVVHARGRVRRDPYGRAAAFHGAATDITGRAQAARDLRRANAFLEQLIESAKTLVVCLDASGRVLICNKAVERLTGYSRTELIGTDWFEALVPRDRFPDIPETFRSVLHDTDFPEFYENPVVTKGGVLRFISWQNSRFPGVDGQVFVVSFGHDITEQVKAEEALKKSRIQAALLSDFLENSLQPFLAAQADGRIAILNKAFADLLGYSRDELLWLDWIEDLSPPENLAAEREHLGRLTQTGQPVRYEKEFLRKDGSRVPVEMYVHLHKRASGSVDYCYAFISDMTESKASRERLQAALAAVEASSRAKSEFLANMSHEIRTPISAILGLAELSLRVPDPESSSQHLRMISESAKTLLAIIGDVLDLSRVEAGKLELECRPFRLADVIQKALAPFRSPCEAKGLGLSARVEPGVPEFLLGDPVRLGQVLTNLLGNACKFTGEGRIEVAVARMAAVSPSLAMLHFSVADTGIGIAPSQTALIFESFRQADSSYSKSYQGAGLGLAICRELTALMGGRIWVESTQGQGSTFHFNCVFELAKGLEATLPQALDTHPAVSRARVLVAEDNPFNRHVFEQYLKLLGHDVKGVADGQAALDALRQDEFDMVFMDVQMPKLDGLEVVRRIRSGDCGLAAARLPIVALTAYAMQGDRERFLDAGMTEYLAKPVTLESIKKAVERLAGQHDAQAAPPPATGVPDPFKPLLKDYILFIREKTDLAQQLLEDGDLANAAKVGHDIKGTSLAFGVEGINQAGASFDMACRAGDQAGASVSLAEIRTALQKFETGYAVGQG